VRITTSGGRSANLKHDVNPANAAVVSIVPASKTRD
jgi:hypothetical protein